MRRTHEENEKRYANVSLVFLTTGANLDLLSMYYSLFTYLGLNPMKSEKKEEEKEEENEGHDKITANIQANCSNNNNIKRERERHKIL